MRELKLGSRGEDVREWNDFLTKTHILPPPRSREHAAVRFFFDERTATATRKFQEQNGLVPTGTVDAATFQRATRIGLSLHAEASPGYGASAEHEMWLNAEEIVNRNIHIATKVVFNNEGVFANKAIPDKISAHHCLFVAKMNPEDAAMVAAIWAKESNFALNPDGDAGPAQLNYFWVDVHPELIAGDAYGTWTSPRKNVPFDGDVIDNLITLGNIVRYQRNRGNNYSRAAYEYAPSKDQEHPQKTESSVRSDYQKDVMSRYGRYLTFFKTILDPNYSPPHK